MATGVSHEPWLHWYKVWSKRDSTQALGGRSLPRVSEWHQAKLVVQPDFPPIQAPSEQWYQAPSDCDWTQVPLETSLSSVAEWQLVKPLVAGGLPSLGVRALGNARECIYAAGLPALASFELAGWDAGALGRDGGLRDLAARGAKEALRTVGGGKWLFAIAPTTMMQMMLRAAPLLPRPPVGSGLRRSRANRTGYRRSRPCR